MRPGSASANGSRQTCTWYRTEVITAAPPLPGRRHRAPPDTAAIRNRAADRHHHHHHRRRRRSRQAPAPPLSRPLAAHATVSTLLLRTALRGAQRQHQPHRQDHPVTLTLARNRNPEQADMRYNTVAVPLACQTPSVGRRTPRRTHPPACTPRGRRARPGTTGSARDGRPAPARNRRLPAAAAAPSSPRYR